MTGGPVFWVLPDWTPPARPHGPGMVRFLDPPGRVTFVHANRPEDILWTLEEVLRAGVVPPLVVGDLPGPPGLTPPVRRMHLAAEAGGGEALGGLILTPPEGAAQGGVESRWRMTPDHSPPRARPGA